MNDFAGSLTRALPGRSTGFQALLRCCTAFIRRPQQLDKSTAGARLYLRERSPEVQAAVGYSPPLGKGTVMRWVGIETCNREHSSHG